MPQSDGNGHLSIRRQAAIYGISKSEMARDRADGCPADEEGGRKWRAAHRRPYLRSVQSAYRELEHIEDEVPSSDGPENGMTMSPVGDTEPIAGNGNGNGQGTTAASLGRLRVLEQSLAKAAEAALARGDTAEGLSISRQHALVVSRLVSTETAWAKLQERRRELLPSEWLIKFTYCYRRPVALLISDYLAKAEDPKLRQLADELEQVVNNFCNTLTVHVNGG